MVGRVASWFGEIRGYSGYRPQAILLRATRGIRGNGSGGCVIARFTPPARKYVNHEFHAYARRVYEARGLVMKLTVYFWSEMPAM
jgi:hypothetical protein